MLFEVSLSLKFSRKPIQTKVKLISEYWTISSLHNEDFYACIMCLLTIKRLPNQSTSYPHFQEDAEKANLYIIWSCISTWIIILQNRFDLGIQHPQMFSHVAYHIIKIGLARVFLIMHKGTNNRFYENICIHVPTALKIVDINCFSFCLTYNWVENGL